jgi:two-component system sensor histidine kinase MprB
MSYGWSAHYRQSLASRVTILTTMAVGFAVTVVSFAAYATVRTQTISALDDSLRSRAVQVNNGEAFAINSRTEVPAWMMGASDVHIMLLDQRRPSPMAPRSTRPAPWSPRASATGWWPSMPIAARH